MEFICFNHEMVLLVLKLLLISMADYCLELILNNVLNFLENFLWKTLSVNILVRIFTGWREVFLNDA